MEIRITLHIPPTLTQKARNIKNIEQYANQALIEALQRESEATPLAKKQSKWAIYALNAPSPLKGTSRHILECSKEIREDFTFKHDLTAENV